MSPAPTTRIQKLGKGELKMSESIIGLATGMVYQPYPGKYATDITEFSLFG